MVDTEHHCAQLVSWTPTRVTRLVAAIIAGPPGCPGSPRAVWKQENIWHKDSWEQANQRCRQLTGQGLSRQTWGLLVKLREANECPATDQYPLHEVHPEVSFAAMNGQPLEHRKISWTGHITRRRQRPPRRRTRRRRSSVGRLEPGSGG